MNHALNQTYAKSRTSPCGALVRLARRGAAVLALACLGIGAAHAQPQHRDEGQQGARSERFQLPRDGDQRAGDGRAYEARDEQRRQPQAQQEQSTRNADNARRSGRMTPDERRDLRRQINEAGMDLYAHPPRH
jgi:hypothetical protein